MSKVKTVSFEAGYDRLQEIAERVSSEEVSVGELCDLFAEGKGLEKALTDYLTEQKARVEKIERGEGIQVFQVEAPESPAAADGEGLEETLDLDFGEEAQAGEAAA